MYNMGNPSTWLSIEKVREKDIPFDIRQYNCLFWEENNMDEFKKKLQYRIENIIGKGPLKNE